MNQDELENLIKEINDYSSVVLKFFYNNKKSAEDLYKVISKDSVEPIIKELINKKLMINNGYITLTKLGLVVYEKLWSFE